MSADARHTHRRAQTNRQRADELTELATRECQIPGQAEYFVGLADAYRNAARLMEPEAEPTASPLAVWRPASGGQCGILIEV